MADLGIFSLLTSVPTITTTQARAKLQILPGWSSPGLPLGFIFKYMGHTSGRLEVRRERKPRASVVLALQRGYQGKAWTRISLF